MTRFARWTAAWLALVPAVAQAHGDHRGTGGLDHLLANPELLGLLLLAGAAASLPATRISGMLRRSIGKRWRPAVERKGAG